MLCNHHGHSSFLHQEQIISYYLLPATQLIPDVLLAIPCIQ